MNSLLISMIVLSFGVAATQAVECYYCVSLLGTNPDCEADPLNSTLLTTSTCDGQCKKALSSIDGTITSLTRTCDTACVDTGCSSFFGLKDCNSCCDDELCNGAEFLTISRVVVMASTLMGFALFAL